MTIQGKVLTVSTFKFSDPNEDPASDKVELNLSADFDLDKFAPHDFKVSERDDQFRLLFRLKDETARKSAENNNFALLIVNRITGDLEAMKEFNIGGEKISSTGCERIKDPALMDPVYDAWLDHGQECKIIEARNKQKTGSDRPHCLLHHKVQLGSEGRRFFHRLESM